MNHSDDGALQARPSTRARTIPPPPRLPRESGSDPPIHHKGVSWRVVAAVLGAIFAALVPTLTVVLEAGGIRQAVVDVRDELSDLRRDVRSISEREIDTRERVVALKTRVDVIERDVEALKRVSRQPSIGPLRE